MGLDSRYARQPMPPPPALSRSLDVAKRGGISLVSGLVLVRLLPRAVLKGSNLERDTLR